MVWAKQSTVRFKIENIIDGLLRNTIQPSLANTANNIWPIWCVALCPCQCKNAAKFYECTKMEIGFNLNSTEIHWQWHGMCAGCDRVYEICIHE